MSSLAALAIVASSLLGQAADQPPSAAQMKEFGGAMVGKWVGESTVDFDLPGVCEKGDKLIIHRSTEWALEGTALLKRTKFDINGKTVAESVALLGWDATRKGILQRFFGDLGGTGQGVWKKQGDTWRFRGQGVLPSEQKLKKSSSVNILTFVDADTYVVNATQRKMDEEKLPNRDTKYKRVK